jgi:dCTP deaminase
MPEPTDAGAVAGLGDRPGVWPDTALRVAIDRGWIDAGEFKIGADRIQPASLDLTLGDVAHRLRASFLPDREPVEHKLKELSEGRLDLSRGADGGFLEQGVSYLVELREKLALPDGVRARANPKSSTGRLDVFTRVITDKSYQFDEIPERYEGKLYLEIAPLSFPIRICEGLSLNQLRLLSGSSPRLTDTQILAEHSNDALLFGQNGKPTKSPVVANGLLLSLDLIGDNDTGMIGYKARRHTRLLDLTTGEPSDTRDFWEPVFSERGHRIVLEPESFYLLMSQERVRIPPHLASEMVAYDPTSGELRTHYAGFFDPGFGVSTKRGSGSRAALEVRAHDVPFLIEHGQGVCKLSFEYMAQPPKRLYGADVSSNYQGQTSTLSKYFTEATGR